MHIVNPVAVLWDIASFHIPKGLKEEDIAVNVRTFLRVHGSIQGPICVFSAYGDLSSFPSKMRKGCQNTGVNLIDIPNGNKGESHKAILVDMCLFALDHPPPCNIVLLSNDIDFAPALHKLGQLGYTLLLITPSISPESSALYSACAFVWTWSFVLKKDWAINNIDQKSLASHHCPENFCNGLKECEADPIGKCKEKFRNESSKSDLIADKENLLAHMQRGYQREQNLVFSPKDHSSSHIDKGMENIMNISSNGKSMESKMHHDKTRSPLKNLTNVLHCQHTDNTADGSMAKEHYVDPLGVNKTNGRNEVYVKDRSIKDKPFSMDPIGNQTRSGHKQKSRCGVSKYPLNIERRKKKKTDNGNTGDPSQLLCVHKRKLACDRTRTHIYVQRKKKKTEGLITTLHESKTKVVLVSRCSTALLFSMLLCKKKRLIAHKEVSDGLRRVGKASVNKKKSLSSSVAVESNLNSNSTLDNGQVFARKSIQPISSPYNEPTSAEIMTSRDKKAEGEYRDAKEKTSYCVPRSSVSIKMKREWRMKRPHLATTIPIRDVSGSPLDEVFNTIHAPVPVSKNVPKVTENMGSVPMVTGQSYSGLKSAPKQVYAASNSIASVTLEKAHSIPNSVLLKDGSSLVKASGSVPSDNKSIRKGTVMTMFQEPFCRQINKVEMEKSDSFKVGSSVVQDNSSNINTSSIEPEETVCSYKHVAITRETSKIPGQPLCGRKRKRRCFKVKKNL